MWEMISVAQLEQYLDARRAMVLVDLRDRMAFRQEHIAGAISIPWEELDWHLQELPRNEWLVFYCYHGPRSMMAARQLARQGWQTADVSGGIDAYRAYGGKYLVW